MNTAESTYSGNWQLSAACREEDPELFFPTGTDGPWALVIEEAKTVCRRCPVVNECLRFALDDEIPAGIFGGLTERERVSLRRSVKRGWTPAENVPAKAHGARQQRSERSPKSLFSGNTTPLFGGHLGWTGNDHVYCDGRKYTPRQVAFIADRERTPEGPVLLDCGTTDCVLPAHLTDQVERAYCGTRDGHRRHLLASEEPCERCHKAHTDATGTQPATTAA